MKNFINTIFTISLFLLGSCTFNGQDGAPGPVGPPGQDGINGSNGQDGKDGEEAYIFEYSKLSFSASNEYRMLLEIPQNFEMLPTDVVLVYFLYDYIEEDDLDVWRALPQTEFTDFGTLLYNYDFTIFDVSVFLDGNFNLDLLAASYTDDWIARVVVVPGQDPNARTTNSVDYTDYNAVLETYNLTESDIITVK